MRASGLRRMREALGRWIEYRDQIDPLWVKWAIDQTAKRGNSQHTVYLPFIIQGLPSCAWPMAREAFLAAERQGALQLLPGINETALSEDLACVPKHDDVPMLWAKML
jgi:hypothetical protein